MGNQIRTTVLLAAMTALIIWIGQLLGGRLAIVDSAIIVARTPLSSGTSVTKLEI